MGKIVENKFKLMEGFSKYEESFSTTLKRVDNLELSP